jgi:integrase
MRAMLRWMARKQYVTREWTQGILDHDAVQDALEDYPATTVVREQLTLNEARAFAAAAKAEAKENPRGAATGALMALLLDMRAKEVISRVARNVDDGGRIVWVTDTKTSAGERAMSVADEDLQALLAIASEGLRSQDLVFQFTRHALYETVNRICRDCGIPEVGCHGLRRTFSTLAVMSGVAEEAVAAALGHTGFGITKKHYVAPGTVEQKASNAVMRRLRSI